MCGAGPKHGENGRVKRRDDDERNHKKRKGSEPAQTIAGAGGGWVGRGKAGESARARERGGGKWRRGEKARHRRDGARPGAAKRGEGDSVTTKMDLTGKKCGGTPFLSKGEGDAITREVKMEEEEA